MSAPDPADQARVLRLLRENMGQIRALVTSDPATMAWLAGFLRREEDKRNPQPGRPTTKLVQVNDAGRLVGEAHPRSKLSDRDVELVLAMRDEGLSHRQLAEKFEISRAQVGRVLRSETRNQLVTRSVRRPIKYDEPEFEAAAWWEFAVVPEARH